MIAHLSPHVALQSHPAFRTQTKARAAGLALAAVGHGALILWLVSQTFRPPNLVDNTPPPSPMTIQTLDLTPPQPAPKSPVVPANNNVHAAPTPVDQTVKTLPVRVATIKATGPVSVNPFVNPGVGGAPILAPPTLPHVLTNPQWISMPSADQVARAYPEGALRQGIAGMAMLSCQVTAAGGVVGCKVNTETPASRGFGRAALGLTPYFRIRPGADNGEPIEGASVQIPVRFQITG